MKTKIDISKPFEITYRANSFTSYIHTVEVDSDYIEEEFCNEIYEALGEEGQNDEVKVAKWIKDNSDQILEGLTDRDNSNHNGEHFSERGSDWQQDLSTVEQGETQEDH